MSDIPKKLPSDRIWSLAMAYIAAGHFAPDWDDIEGDQPGLKLQEAIGWAAQALLDTQMQNEAGGLGLPGDGNIRLFGYPAVLTPGGQVELKED